MRNMRRTIEEHNVYRWAASLIVAVSELSVQEDKSGKAVPRSVS